MTKKALRPLPECSTKPASHSSPHHLVFITWCRWECLQQFPQASVSSCSSVIPFLCSRCSVMRGGRRRLALDLLPLTAFLSSAKHRRGDVEVCHICNRSCSVVETQFSECYEATEQSVWWNGTSILCQQPRQILWLPGSSVCGGSLRTTSVSE